MLNSRESLIRWWSIIYIIIFIGVALVDIMFVFAVFGALNGGMFLWAIALIFVAFIYTALMLLVPKTMLFLLNRVENE